MPPKIFPSYLRKVPTIMSHPVTLVTFYRSDWFVRLPRDHNNVEHSAYYIETVPARILMTVKGMGNCLEQKQDTTII